MFRNNLPSATLIGMKIGYARVSTTDQNLDRQIAALKKAGCKKIYSEKQSGKSLVHRPELEKAIEALNVEDVLVLAEWDRATRSMRDGIQIMERVYAKAARIKVLDRDWLDLTTPLGQGILAFLSSLAEDERDRINRRAAEGRHQARRKGMRLGRRPKLSRDQRAEILKMLREGRSTRSVASLFNCGVATIQRVKDSGK